MSEFKKGQRVRVTANYATSTGVTEEDRKCWYKEGTITDATLPVIQVEMDEQVYEDYGTHFYFYPEELEPV